MSSEDLPKEQGSSLVCFVGDDARKLYWINFRSPDESWRLWMTDARENQPLPKMTFGSVLNRERLIRTVHRIDRRSPARQMAKKMKPDSRQTRIYSSSLMVFILVALATSTIDCFEGTATDLLNLGARSATVDPRSGQLSQNITPISERKTEINRSRYLEPTTISISINNDRSIGKDEVNSPQFSRLLASGGINKANHSDQNLGSTAPVVSLSTAIALAGPAAAATNSKPSSDGEQPLISARAWTHRDLSNNGLQQVVSASSPTETMLASASKKKKKMIKKKKKKMEKKHKEWKKGKKHKKKKYESKKKKGGMEKKKKGKKEKKKWGMEKKGHKKKGNFKKKKWGSKKKMKKGHKKGKKGHKMLKDKGHKKKGFKKVYHKEEWGKKKKWHDIKREKKWNSKQKKWKKKWHQEKGKKYKGKHMKKYHKKNKHGKKYKKEKKSKWKKHKGEKFKKGHKKKKEEYAKKKEGGKKKKMKKMEKKMKKKKG